MLRPYSVLKSQSPLCRPYAKHEIHVISLKLLRRDVLYRIRFPKYCFTTLFGGGITFMHPYEMQC